MIIEFSGAIMYIALLSNRINLNKLTGFVFSFKFLIYIYYAITISVTYNHNSYETRPFVVFNLSTCRYQTIYVGVYYLLFAKMRSRDCSREFNALNTMVVARRMADALVENRWRMSKFPFLI